MAKNNAYLKKIKSLAATNLTAGEDFLAKNKERPEIITTTSGLQYEVLEVGSGVMPTKKDKILCHYSGRFLNNDVFDSSYKRGRPESLPIKDLIKGWQEALLLMPVGSKWKLYVHPSLGYGFESLTKDSGGNCTLIFEIELLSIL